MSHAFINTKGDYMLELHNEILIEANAVAELERERILDMLRRWDSTPVDLDNTEYDLKVFDEMHRAFTIGYEYGEEAREERLIWLLKDLEKTTFPGDVWHINPFTYAIEMIERLRNDNNSK